MVHLPPPLLIAQAVSEEDLQYITPAEIHAVAYIRAIRHQSCSNPPDLSQISVALTPHWSALHHKEFACPIASLRQKCVLDHILAMDIMTGNTHKSPHNEKSPAPPAFVDFWSNAFCANASVDHLSNTISNIADQCPDFVDCMQHVVNAARWADAIEASFASQGFHISVS
jgi:hypothetical protein